MPTWVLHRDERFWDDPETFRPERFLPGEDGASPDRPDFAYFPFAAGRVTASANGSPCSKPS